MDYKAFADEIIKSSMSLEVKAKQLVFLCENTLPRAELNDEYEYDCYPLVNRIFEFFADNSNVMEKFMLDELNEFLALITVKMEKIFPRTRFDSLFEYLKSKQNSPLFQKSSNFWMCLFLLEKTLNEPANTKIYYMTIDKVRCMKRPLVEKPFSYFQKAHDFFEKHGCCSENKEFLSNIYLRGLLEVTTLQIVYPKIHDQVDGQSESTDGIKTLDYLHSDPKFKPILDNTKQEVIRLLKCLFGMEFKTQLCNHALTSSEPQNLDKELVEQILLLYLPRDLNSIINGEKIDEELVEMCEKLYPSIENMLTKEVKDEFKKYFALIETYYPKYRIDGGTMEKLSCSVKMKIDIAPYSVNIGVLAVPMVLDESSKWLWTRNRQIFANACYVLMHNKSDKKLNLDSISLAKQALMFGQHDLDYKFVSQTWLFIGKCMEKEIDAPNFKVSEFKKIVSPFYMSLMFNKESAEIHICLALTLLRLILRHKSQLALSSSTPASDNQDMPKEFLKRFVDHIQFATFYIKWEENIETVLSVMNILIEAFETNVTYSSHSSVQEFFKSTSDHLISLINEKIQEPDSCSNHFIQTIYVEVLELDLNLKTLYPISHDKAFDALRKDLKKMWMTVSKESQQTNIELNKENDQLKTKNSELQTKLDKTLTENTELAKKNGNGSAQS